ncbi:MAG: hypothetical protein K2Y22_03430 [Candidatus Obscuribacterales bacterium]|nr:hypothetical protein [Candidatus Obscuribacterales bacterium]
MFDINPTLIIFVLSFLAFMYLLNQIMLKPVGRVLEARAAKISGDLKAGKDAHGQAGDLVTHYQEHLHKIRSEAQSVINEATQKANQGRNDELGKIKAEGAKKLEAAKAQIVNERKALVDPLVNQEIELIEDIAHKLLGERVSLSVDRERVKSALEVAS